MVNPNDNRRNFFTKEKTDRRLTVSNREADAPRMSYQPELQKNYFEDSQVRGQVEDQSKSLQDEDEGPQEPADTVENILARSRKLRRKYSKLTKHYRQKKEESLNNFVQGLDS